VDFVVFLSEEWLLVGLLGVLVTAFMMLESKNGGQSLSVHEVTRLVNSGDGILLDVRDSKEFKAGHIVDALNIPHQKLAGSLDQLSKHKSKTIIVVDKMGQHAGASGKVLTENGYTVSRLKGGMAEWTGQNLPVVKK